MEISDRSYHKGEADETLAVETELGWVLSGHLKGR